MAGDDAHCDVESVNERTSGQDMQKVLDQKFNLPSKQATYDALRSLKESASTKTLAVPPVSSSVNTTEIIKNSKTRKPPIKTTKTKAVQETTSAPASVGSAQTLSSSQRWNSKLKAVASSAITKRGKNNENKLMVRCCLFCFVS